MNPTHCTPALLALAICCLVACTSVPDSGATADPVVDPTAAPPNRTPTPAPTPATAPLPQNGSKVPSSAMQPAPRMPIPDAPTPPGPIDPVPTPDGGHDAGAEPAPATNDAGTDGDNEPAQTEMLSAGCGMTAAAGPTGTWTKQSVSINGGNRSYDVRLPKNYDAAHGYPAILLLHGCGSPTNNVPMEQVAGDSAIIVRGSGTNNGCWYETASGADLPYLDALMEDVENRLCVRADQWFAVGYSSGSWLANTLSCHRGAAFRGIATVTGGEPQEIANCVGQHGRIYLHDATDNNNRIAWDRPSRDRMLQTNHCAMNTMPFDPAPCVEYQDCDPGYPVVWCETSGQGHSRQDALARQAFWNLFQRLIQE